MKGKDLVLWFLGSRPQEEEVEELLDREKPLVMAALVISSSVVGVRVAADSSSANRQIPSMDVECLKLVWKEVGGFLLLLPQLLLVELVLVKLPRLWTDLEAFIKWLAAAEALVLNEDELWA